MEKKQLLSFLDGTVSAFEKQDIFALKEAGNKAIEEAALANDRQLAKLALVAYALFKMSGKQHIVRHDKWRDVKHDILFDLRKAAKAVESGNAEEFEYRLQATIDSVKATDKEMGNYVQNVFEKARVKYASTAYSFGLSLGQSAALTGADKKQLLRYIGVTRIADREAVTTGIGERLKKLKEGIGGSRA